MRWTPRDQDHYVTEWEDRTWHLKLVAKPPKPPWLLYREDTENGRLVKRDQQEIGGVTVEAAQSRAALWLETAKYVK